MTSSAVYCSLRALRFHRLSLNGRRRRFIDSVMYYVSLIHGHQATGHLSVPRGLIRNLQLNRKREYSTFCAAHSATEFETEFNLEISSYGLSPDVIEQTRVKKLIADLQGDVMRALKYLIHCQHQHSNKELVELTLVLTNNEQIYALNRRHYSIESSTDVLCVPHGETGRDRRSPVMILGDLYLSLEAAERQAKVMGHDLVTEFRILVIHGLLRLLGHDHNKSDKDWKETADLEKETLKELGWKGKGLIADIKRLMMLDGSQEKTPVTMNNDQGSKIDQDRRIRRGLHFAPDHGQTSLERSVEAEQQSPPVLSALTTTNGIRLVALELDSNMLTESKQEQRLITNSVQDKITHSWKLSKTTEEFQSKVKRVCKDCVQGDIDSLFIESSSIVNAVPGKSSGQSTEELSLPDFVTDSIARQNTENQDCLRTTSVMVGDELNNFHGMPTSDDE
eukprot:g8297.t1